MSADEPGREIDPGKDSHLSSSTAPFTSSVPQLIRLEVAKPLVLASLSAAERTALVVASVVDQNGQVHPMCFFGDPVWYLASKVEVKNIVRSNTRIVWPTDLPIDLVTDVKIALYCALHRVGRAGRRPLCGHTILNNGRAAIVTLRYLASLGICNFSELRPLHLSDHIQELRHKIGPATIRNRLAIIERIYECRDDVLYPLSCHPWGGKSLPLVCGLTEEAGGHVNVGKL